MSSSRFLLVALALLGALLALPSGSGEEIVVDVNGNGDYTTIEDGLEAAEDGDLVRIWNGTYVEYNLTIEDQIIVRGNGTSTVVNASWEGHGFIVEHDYVEISHLKVESSANGTAPEGPYYAYFSGVYVNANEGANLHLESLVLEGNYVGLVVDGQFYIHVSNSTITGSTYIGAHFHGSWYLSIDNSTISNNGGRGILCYYCHHARIYYSSFESNGDQGVKSEYAFNQTFYETDFEDNTGVGLYMHHAKFNSVRHAEFTNNKGGITLTSSSNQNEIVGCEAYGNEDHGYLFTSGSTSNYLNSSNAWSNEYALVFVDSSHNNTVKYGWYEGDEKKVLFTGTPSTGIVLHEVSFDAEDLSINTGSELLIKKSLHVKVTDNGTSDSWKIYDNQSDENREAYSGTHAMWLGDPDKNEDDEGGDGEYEDNWDFSFYTKDEISLGNSPQLSIATWYETEDIYDGGHVQ
ncbi:MAG: right-handed parallel beta-helix repeat-containing protein, partial [Candidatus Poseidoniia archaeon]|nr:right-handed parallel beta-helix repeat-containing protein [Candidatus Poseidoniia archaeon]